MQKCLVSLVLGLCVFAYVAPLWANPETVTGEVVSYSCYLQNKRNVGKAGYVCTIGDVKWEGNPPGLLTADGKVYELAGPLLANNNAKVVPYLGQTVTITGDVSQKDGTSILTASDLTAK